MTSTESMADLANRLVQSIQPETTHNHDKLEAAAARVLSRIASSEGGTRKEWTDVKRFLQGLSRSAKIRVQDDISAAYDKLIEKLEDHRRIGGMVWDEQLPLQTSNLPQHVQLLLELSEPTTEKTQQVADEYLERPPKGVEVDPLFREIMSEPFTGEHWGPGYDEEVHQGWTDSEEDDRITESDEEIVTPLPTTARPATGPSPREVEAQRRAEAEQRLLMAKLSLRELSRNAYWKTGGAPLVVEEGVHGWQKLSSLPAMSSPALKGHHADRTISAGQLQRELLFALTGRPGVLFSFSAKGECQVKKPHPEVSSFSPAALASVLATFAAHATRAATLRVFVQDTLACPPSLSPLTPPPTCSQTRQAFGEACRLALHDLGLWVSKLEAELIGSTSQSSVNDSTSTPLQLETAFVTRFGELFSYLVDFIPLSSSPILLLNTIYAAVNSPTTRHIRPALVRIFIQSATPMWGFIGDWVVNGMPVPESLSSQDVELALQNEDNERALPSEFFIHRDRDSAWCDEDFWEAGFVVGPEGWPHWIRTVQEDVLEGGKARGLLQSMPLQDWELVKFTALDQLLSPDTEDIDSTLGGYLRPICQDSQQLLGKVLEWDCGLSEHLRAIDGLSLMRAFDVMDNWADWLFAQMQSGKPWADFHLLTHSLRDTIESSNAGWMNSHAVRVRTVRRTRATLSDIRVDYLVPFPLSQVFTPTTMDLRSDVFAFLLRVMRARKLVLMTRTAAEPRLHSDREAVVQLRRLRHRMSWFLSTLWTWINNVIEISMAAHRARIDKDTSFHGLVNLELNYALKLRAFCFLNAESEAALHVVDGVLDLAEELYKIVCTTIGPVTTEPRRRRSRQREVELSDDSDDDQEEPEEVAEPSPPATLQQLSLVAEQLDTHVRKLSRSVDDLAAQPGEPAETRDLWGMLAFALGDWKEP